VRAALRRVAQRGAFGVHEQPFFRMRPVSACLGQEVRLCLIAVFGGLSPLRGPLAAGAADDENSKRILGDARDAPLAAFLDVA
jgi:hypothetical protein